MNSMIYQVYSEALFKLGVDKNLLSTYKKDLRLVEDTIKSNDDLRSLLTNPRVEKEDKKEIVSSVFGGIERDSLNFIKVLIDKQRLDYFDGILDSFVSMCNDQEGVAEATITSARPLDKEDLEAIKVGLSKKLGKKIELKELLDPDLIGGFSVRVGGQMIDNSIKERLLNLESSLKEKR